MELIQLDRVPPQSIEAEQAVLGSVFLNADALIEAMEYIDSADFYRRSHQLLFQTMLDLNNRNEAIDVITMKTELEQKQLLEDVGGISYLSELTTNVPTAANVGHYAKIVEQKSLLRRLIQTATDIVTKGFEQDEDVEFILDEAERQIL